MALAKISSTKLLQEMWTWCCVCVCSCLSSWFISTYCRERCEQEPISKSLCRLCADFSGLSACNAHFNCHGFIVHSFVGVWAAFFAAPKIRLCKRTIISNLIMSIIRIGCKKLKCDQSEKNTPSEESLNLTECMEAKRSNDFCVCSEWGHRALDKRDEKIDSQRWEATPKRYEELERR